MDARRVAGWLNSFQLKIAKRLLKDSMAPISKAVTSPSEKIPCLEVTPDVMAPLPETEKEEASETEKESPLEEDLTLDPDLLATAEERKDPTLALDLPPDQDHTQDLDLTPEEEATREAMREDPDLPPEEITAETETVEEPMREDSKSSLRTFPGA